MWVSITDAHASSNGGTLCLSETYAIAPSGAPGGSGCTDGAFFDVYQVSVQVPLPTTALASKVTSFKVFDSGVTYLINIYPATPAQTCTLNFTAVTGT